MKRIFPPAAIAGLSARGTAAKTTVRTPSGIVLPTRTATGNVSAHFESTSANASGRSKNIGATTLKHGMQYHVPGMF